MIRQLVSDRLREMLNEKQIAGYWKLEPHGESGEEIQKREIFLIKIKIL